MWNHPQRFPCPIPLHASRTASAAFAEAVIAALPGLTLTGGIALAAFALRQIPGVGMFSPMILATVIGMLFHNLVGTPAICRPGVVFSLKKILRLGIILLGFQLMLSQVAAVGVIGVAIILVTLVATFVVHQDFWAASWASIPSWRS